MNVVQKEPYLSISVVIMLNTLLIIIISIFNTHSEINIQPRCSNIKHNPGADSQVGQPMAGAKVIQKSLSFLKRMWSTI